MTNSILGIPVVRSATMSAISEVRGIWPWKRVFIGPQFERLEPRCQGAVLLHEAGHAKLLHLEKRIAYAIANFWRPSAVARYCREQEFQADAFAAGCGYAQDLALVFARVEAVSSLFHPSPKERIERLVSTLRTTYG